MIGKLVWNASFFAVLLKIDRDLAREAHAGGCPHCGAALHQANYPRKPRGTVADGRQLRVLRYSFCCSQDGCRRRLTPPSARFLGRKVYLGGVVVLAAALGWRRVSSLHQPKEGSCDIVNAPGGPLKALRPCTCEVCTESLHDRLGDLRDPSTPTFEAAQSALQPPT